MRVRKACPENPPTSVVGSVKRGHHREWLHQLLQEMDAEDLGIPHEILEAFSEDEE